MKIFFAGSHRGKKEFGTYYQKIHDVIANLGHKHVESSFLQQTPEEFYTKLDQGGRNAHITFYEHNMKKIKEADINIFDCSLHSLSIGFQIEKSLEYNKPTIVLYYDNNVPYFLDGINNEKMIVKSYSKSNIEKVVEQAIELSKNLCEKRFNFFISPMLLTYLNKVSAELGITKSTFIRNLIIEHKKKRKNQE